MYKDLNKCYDTKLRIKFIITLIPILFTFISLFIMYQTNTDKFNEYLSYFNITEIKKSEQSTGQDMIDQIMISATGKTFDEFMSNPN